MLDGSTDGRFAILHLDLEFSMSTEHPSMSPVFQIDVSADAANPASADYDPDRVMIALLQQLVASQERQIRLLEDIHQQLGAQQRQQAADLQNWKERNPDLAQWCRYAAESLSRVQVEFLEKLTNEIQENEEHLMDGEFMFHEFVDRFGPRLAHLNGMLHVLGQLAAPPDSNNSNS